MDSPLKPKAALLWALGDGKACGGELAVRVRERTGRVVNLPDGTLYPTLDALVEQKLARALRGAGRRRYYELTPKGVDALRGMLATLRALLFPMPAAVAPTRPVGASGPELTPIDQRVPEAGVEPAPKARRADPAVGAARSDSPQEGREPERWVEPIET